MLHFLLKRKKNEKIPLDGILEIPHLFLIYFIYENFSSYSIPAAQAATKAVRLAGQQAHFTHSSNAGWGCILGQVIEFAAFSALSPAGGARRSPFGGLKDITANRAFPNAVRFLAAGLFETHKISLRAAALFATQQRWLLSHVALAHYFRPFDTVEPGVSRRSLGLLGPLLGIASRNTSYTLFEEAMKYGVLQTMDRPAVGGAPLAEPSQAALSLIALWYIQHFEALDLLDGGQRHVKFKTQGEGLLPVIQPVVTQGLLSCPELRAPGQLYTIFTWTDSGGWLMDRLIAGIDWNSPPLKDRYLTDIGSITYLAQTARLSRAHTSRKFAEAQSIGGLGWTGRPGRSTIWISRRFYEEYAEFQARKLLILDHALAAALNT